ncbi:hypothetical protein [Deinococcus altitudinis]|uniref:hypothetical protein n=1 Tax=Deinococcus altitudinis TaxID=468914 RepID=UPI0038917508
MKNLQLLTLLALSSAASVALAAPSTFRLLLNGAASPYTAIVVNGTTYVPVGALTPLGVKAVTTATTLSLSSGAAPATPSAGSGNGAGGAVQRASVSGCVNEYLFNGIWRFRVTKVSVMTDPSRGDYPYYSVTAELKNGTTKTIKPVDTGIETSTAVALSFSDGDSLTYNYRSDWVDKTFGKVIQGSGFVYTFPFYPGEKLPLDQVQANRPQKLLFEVDPAKLDKDLKLGFTVPDPSFRVDLTCTK